MRIETDESQAGAAQGGAHRKTALEGIRVVDLTQFEAGTSCTESLAWMGAEVIKIEQPGRGEQGRRATSLKGDTDSVFFLLLNANKKSVTCNLKHPEGLRLVQDLIRNADIFVENFGPGVIERLGLGYEEVRKLNPRIIYAQIKGFAPDGPFANFLAFDAIAQAAGGSVSVTGEADGRPLKPGINVADTGTGLHCTIGILAALHQRHFTGEGQRIEVAMQEAIINFGRIGWAAQALHNAPAPRVDNQSIIAGTSPSEVYPCRGGGANDYIYIYTTRAGNHHWEALMKIMGREDLSSDPRFLTPGERAKNYLAVDAEISRWTRTQDKVEAMKVLGAAGVPASAIFDTQELSDDEHLRKRGAFVTVDHPQHGKFVMPGWPVKMSGSPVTVEAAPLLGSDTDEIYGRLLGKSPDELRRMRDEKII